MLSTSNVIVAGASVPPGSVDAVTSTGKSVPDAAAPAIGLVMLTVGRVSACAGRAAVSDATRATTAARAVPAAVLREGRVTVCLHEPRTSRDRRAPRRRGPHGNPGVAAADHGSRK